MNKGWQTGGGKKQTKLSGIKMAVNFSPILLLFHFPVQENILQNGKNRKKDRVLKLR